MAYIFREREQQLIGSFMPGLPIIDKYSKVGHCERMRCIQSTIFLISQLLILKYSKLILLKFHNVPSLSLDLPQYFQIWQEGQRIDLQIAVAIQYQCVQVLEKCQK